MASSSHQFSKCVLFSILGNNQVELRILNCWNLRKWTRMHQVTLDLRNNNWPRRPSFGPLPRSRGAPWCWTISSALVTTWLTLLDLCYRGKLDSFHKCCRSFSPERWAWTKWPKFYSRRFDVHSLDWTLLYFDTNFTENCFRWSNIN